MSIILLSPDGAAGLSPRSPLPPEILERGQPTIIGHTYHSDAGVSCVVWGATPYRILPKQRPDFEFSILLEGEVILTEGDGSDTIVSAGDAFVLPASCTYQWGQNVPVLKFALSYRPSEPAPEGCVFTPMRAEVLEADGDVADERVVFEEPDGRFRVTVRNLDAGSLFAMGPGKSLVRVVKGSVSLAEERGQALALGTGETAFVSTDTVLEVEAISPARLLVCTVRP